MEKKLGEKGALTTKNEEDRRSKAERRDKISAESLAKMSL